VTMLSSPPTTSACSASRRSRCARRRVPTCTSTRAWWCSSRGRCDDSRKRPWRRSASRPSPGRRRGLETPRARGSRVTRVELVNGARVLVRREPGPVVAMRALALGACAGSRSESGISISSRHCGARPPRASPPRPCRGGGTSGRPRLRFAGGNHRHARRVHPRAGAARARALRRRDAVAHHRPGRPRARARGVLERIKNREDNPAVVAFDLFARHSFPIIRTGCDRSAPRRRCSGSPSEICSLTPSSTPAATSSRSPWS